MSDPIDSVRELEHAVAHRRRVLRARKAAVVVLLAAGLAALANVVLRPRQAPVPAAREAPADAARPQVVVLDQAAQRAAGIAVAPVESRVRTDREEAPAVLTLDETRTARIGSMVEGIVTETVADVGSHVSAGDLLGTIHSHVIHDSWAAYRKAVAERRRQQTELAYAEQSAARARRLYTAKAISAQQLERANADLSSTEELLEMAQAEVRRAADELEHYGIVAEGEAIVEAGEQIPIRTPLAGVVLERQVTPGTAVTIGTSMFVVSDLTSLWAAAEIDETRLSRVAIGRDVQVRVSAYPDESFSGTISFIGDLINPKTRRVTVRSTVPNQDRRLKPEMFATVELGASDPREVATVPAEAIQEIDGQPVVFVLDGPDRFHSRSVEVGPTVDDWVEIRSGLEPGERVATTGSFVLKSELLSDTLSEGE